MQKWLRAGRTVVAPMPNAMMSVTVVMVTATPAWRIDSPTRSCSGFDAWCSSRVS